MPPGPLEACCFNFVLLIFFAVEILLRSPQCPEVNYDVIADRKSCAWSANVRAAHKSCEFWYSAECNQYCRQLQHRLVWCSCNGEQVILILQYVIYCTDVYILESLWRVETTNRAVSRTQSKRKLGRLGQCCVYGPSESIGRRIPQVRSWLFPQFSYISTH